MINNCTSKYYSPTWKASLYFLLFSLFVFLLLSKCTFAKMWPICSFRIKRSATVVVVVSLLTSTKVPCQCCWSYYYILNFPTSMNFFGQCVWQYDDMTAFWVMLTFWWILTFSLNGYSLNLDMQQFRLNIQLLSWPWFEVWLKRAVMPAANWLWFLLLFTINFYQLSDYDLLFFWNGHRPAEKTIPDICQFRPVRGAPKSAQIRDKIAKI